MCVYIHICLHTYILIYLFISRYLYNHIIYMNVVSTLVQLMKAKFLKHFKYIYILYFYIFWFIL